ncbi:MAG: Sua5/YciO/YrdC/YwlC family protein [Phycisphaeraceae bacterium]
MTVETDSPASRAPAVQRAAEMLRAGRLVVLPTETVYGVAAWAGSEAGVAALRRIKQTDASRSFTIHLPDPAEAERYAELASPLARRLVARAMPGPVTLVLDANEAEIADRLEALGLPAEARDRIYRGSQVSLRCPDHPLARAVLGAVDGPVVAASAAPAGERLPTEASDAAELLGSESELGLVLDAGRSRYGKPSTVVRIEGRGSDATMQVQREGVYDRRFLEKLLKWKLLLVCSGNTCRSPMAEVLARQILAEQRGVRPEGLEKVGIEVVSAGVSAARGMPASADAVSAMREQGLDLTRHRSRPVTAGLIHEADVVYTMADHHRRAILAMVPSAADKTFTLDPDRDIEDPIGSGEAVYRRTAAALRSRLEQRLKEQQP